MIVVEVLKKEMHLWKDRIQALVREMPTATEDEIAWRVVEEMSVRAAELLKADLRPRGARTAGCRCRPIRASTGMPTRSWQAVRFAALAPNIIVKIPVTAAGIPAIEEVTYRGISINATVSFSLPQAIAVAEAVERGLKRREREGKAIMRSAPCARSWSAGWTTGSRSSPTSRHQRRPRRARVGRCGGLQEGLRLYQERGYRIRLLSAAFRNHMHWSEFIGGDVVISPPYKWQVRFNASDVEVVPRIDRRWTPHRLGAHEVRRLQRAYAEDGISVADFDRFPPTRRTLRQFISACNDLNLQIREFMIPNPDVTGGRGRAGRDPRPGSTARAPWLLREPGGPVGDEVQSLSEGTSRRNRHQEPLPVPGDVICSVVA